MCTNCKVFSLKLFQCCSIIVQAFHQVLRDTLKYQFKNCQFGIDNTEPQKEKHASDGHSFHYVLTNCNILSFTKNVMICLLLFARSSITKAWFKRRISHVPNLTRELNACEVRRLNQINSTV